MDWLDNKLSPCNVNECIIMTNRKFLTYAFSENFQYEAKFKLDETIDPEDFCAKQFYTMEHSLS